MKRLLIVDDEKMIVSSLKRQLSAPMRHDGLLTNDSLAQLQVLGTTSALAALRVLRHNRGDFDAVLTDWELGGGVTGLEVALAARDEGVKKVIIMSGHPDVAKLSSEGFYILQKPFDASEVVAIMEVSEC